MSKRQEIQEELVAVLNNDSDFWNHPAGIISGITELNNKGKVRDIAFGQRVTLDANIRIWNENKITITAEGPISYLVEGGYGNIQAVIDQLKEAVKTLSGK